MRTLKAVAWQGLEDQLPSTHQPKCQAICHKPVRFLTGISANSCQFFTDSPILTAGTIIDYWKSNLETTNTKYLP